MGTITVRMSDEDSAILANLAKERATAGETILAGVLHDFLQHQAVRMEQRRSGSALASPGEFAPEAEVAALCADSAPRWPRHRG